MDTSKKSAARPQSRPQAAAPAVPSSPTALTSPAAPATSVAPTAVPAAPASAPQGCPQAPHRHHHVMAGSAVVAPPTGRAMWAMMALMLGSDLVASFNQSLMNVALDQVAADFHVTLSVANWMVLGFTIVAATAITMAASLLKRFGLRKVMLFGYIASLIGSLLGFFSWDFGSMLVARLLQSLTVGLFFPVATSVILTISPKDKGATMLALTAGVIGVGLAIAPPLAGLVLTYAGLHALFLIPAVMSVALIICGMLFLHNIYEREHHRIDPLSVALSFAGLAAFIYGLNELTHALGPSLGCMVAGVAILALFAWRQFRIPDPLLNLAPLRHMKFTVGEGLMMLGYSGSIYMSLLVPLYLEGAAGYSAFLAGCLMTAPILCYAVACFFAGRIADAHGIWPLVPGGFLMVLVGFVTMELTSSHLLVVAMMFCAALSYAGVGLVFPTLKAVDLELLPHEMVAHGSSIHSALVQIAGSLGSALFVGIMSADVVRLMGAGIAKADAYAAGFSHTLIIDIVVMAVAFVGSIVFARAMNRRRKARESAEVKNAKAAGPQNA